METLLKMHNIEKYYGSVKALDGAFLEVKREKCMHCWIPTMFNVKLWYNKDNIDQLNSR